MDLRAPTSTDIRYETSPDGIAKITIDRPEVRNAFRPQTVVELSRAFELAREDPEVGRDHPHRRGRAGVLLGRRPARARRLGLRVRARQAGASGASTSPTSTSRSAGCRSRSWRWSRATRSAAATCCTSSATSRSPPRTPASGRPGRASARSTAASAPRILAAQIGQKRAKEIWFLCRQYDAQQALDMGLVNAVVPLERLEEETVAWCREMLALSPFALRLLKASFNASEDGAAGIQQLAHDANLLFYGSPRRRRRAATPTGRSARPDFSAVPAPAP